MARNHSAPRPALRGWRQALAATTILVGLAGGLHVRPAAAQSPSPGAALPAEDVDEMLRQIAAPQNDPITGSSIAADTVGGDRPPSLEALMAETAAKHGKAEISDMRSEALHEAANRLGAQGGLAARAYAINEMLRRNAPLLERTFDFRGLMVPAGQGGQTLMLPPVVTEADMAFALAQNGQVAHESGTIYRITRKAQLVAAPPNWRSYLVQRIMKPDLPPGNVRPKTDQEARLWRQWVAEGWARGEAEAVDEFLSDLNRMKRDLLGMARYNVLLQAGVVEQPRVAFSSKAVEGGNDVMKIENRTVQITSQPGLDPHPAHWHATPTELPGAVSLLPGVN